MIKLHDEKDWEELFTEMKIDCQKCYGFCCVALYFSKVDGFPADKEAGKPCSNLKSDFSCAVHKDLRANGLKGCTVYDCFGAGQKVAQEIYKDKDWRDSSDKANEMFEVFHIIRQLQEMRWYLSEAEILIPAAAIKEKIKELLSETKALTLLIPEEILKIDIEAHRDKVNRLLKKAAAEVNSFLTKEEKDNIKIRHSLPAGKFFLGANLTNVNLIGVDLAGALLIAANLRNADLTGANLIGADLRDADIRGADLSESLFLTQVQVNAAKGNSKTKLPELLSRPSYWEK